MVSVVFFVFLFGLIWGSFLNVVIYRTTHGTSPLSGRSMCPKCKKIISWKNNIPLISFLLLRGRCANCHTRISWRYPVVEFMTGILFVWWYLIGQSFFSLVGSPFNYLQPIFWLIIGMLLLVVFFADLFFGLIPDSVNLMLFSLAFFYRLVLVSFSQMQVVDLYRAVGAAIILTIFFYSLWFFTRGRGFGFGDVKLAPSLALLLGWPRVSVGIFSAFVIGAVLGLGLILFGKRKFGQTIPFGPFLIVGVLVGLLFGNDLWGWYWGLI